MTQRAYKKYQDANGGVGTISRICGSYNSNPYLVGASPIEFGRFVSFTGGLLVTGGADVVGITVATPIIPGTTTNAYPANSIANVCDEGSINMLLDAGSANAEVGGKVYVTVATGLVRADDPDPSDDAVIEVSGAIFQEAGVAGATLAVKYRA